ncbi:hypothetical protein [Limimaricola soesokkakensis]|uniref:hypothetical protein n=1 Tax=Limimaricola soesokkakensis TaxID=1343159 RepID=UPI0035192FC2
MGRIVRIRASVAVTKSAIIVGGVLIGVTAGGIIRSVLTATVIVPVPAIVVAPIVGLAADAGALTITLGAAVARPLAVTLTGGRVAAMPRIVRIRAPIVVAEAAVVVRGVLIGITTGGVIRSVLAAAVIAPLPVARGRTMICGVSQIRPAVPTASGSIGIYVVETSVAIDGIGIGCGPPSAADSIGAIYVINASVAVDVIPPIHCAVAIDVVGIGCGELSATDGRSAVYVINAPVVIDIILPVHAAITVDIVLVCVLHSAVVARSNGTGEAGSIAILTRRQEVSVVLSSDKSYTGRKGPIRSGAGLAEQFCRAAVVYELVQQFAPNGGNPRLRRPGIHFKSGKASALKSANHRFHYRTSRGKGSSRHPDLLDRLGKTACGCAAGEKRNRQGYSSKQRETLHRALQ